MYFSVFLQILTLLAVEPLIFKSGTILDCESIVKHGDWVVVVLSKYDQRYNASGSGRPNKFKIRTEKIDWAETAREMKLRTDRNSQKNISIDQKSLTQYQDSLPKAQLESERVTSQVSNAVESGQDTSQPATSTEQTFQDKYDAVKSKIDGLNQEIAKMEGEIIWSIPGTDELPSSVTKKNLEIEAQINRKMREIEFLEREAEQLESEARRQGKKLNRK